MFDADCDGCLSREEVVLAIGHLLAIKRSQHFPPDSKTLVAEAGNGEVVTCSNHKPPSSTEGGEVCEGPGLGQVAAAKEEEEEEEVWQGRGAEDLADSALKKYGLEKVCMLCVVQ